MPYFLFIGGGAHLKLLEVGVSVNEHLYNPPTENRHDAQGVVTGKILFGVQRYRKMACQTGEAASAVFVLDGREDLLFEWTRHKSETYRGECQKCRTQIIVLIRQTVAEADSPSGYQALSVTNITCPSCFDGIGLVEETFTTRSSKKTAENPTRPIQCCERDHNRDGNCDRHPPRA